MPAFSQPNDEFALIARFFAPLARGAPGSFNLTDDVAQAPTTQQGLLVSCDSMVEGVHFLPNSPLEVVARKLLRRNLSDIYAKGARPIGYLLALMWPQFRSVEEIGAFASGLEDDQAIFNLPLLGGDTTSTPGPLTATITILGESLGRGPVRRAGAGIGDSVFVTGTIGDGGLGLKVAKGELQSLSDADLGWLEGRYHLPQPRMAASRMVAERATAAIDVSDGLTADAARLARASGVRLEIDATKIPLSPPAARWLADQPDSRAARTYLNGAGDDYEVLFCAPASAADDILAQANYLNLRLSVIGQVASGNGVVMLDEQGIPLAAGVGGWRHF